MTDRTHPDSGRIITGSDVIADLQDRIAELEAQLEAIGAGGVEPLRRRECLHQIVAPAPAGEYPALPEPRHRGPEVTGSYFDAFTADQMRAYVDADRAARAPADSVLEDAARLLRQILAASQDGDSDTHLSAHFVSRIETITKAGGAA